MYEDLAELFHNTAIKYTDRVNVNEWDKVSVEEKEKLIKTLKSKIPPIFVQRVMSTLREV